MRLHQTQMFHSSTLKRSLHWMLPWICLAWNLIPHIPSIPNLEASHAIDVSPTSMKFTRNMLIDPKYTHTKNHIKPKHYHINFDIEQKRPLLLVRSVGLHQEHQYPLRAPVAAVLNKHPCLSSCFWVDFHMLRLVEKHKYTFIQLAFPWYWKHVIIAQAHH